MNNQCTSTLTTIVEKFYIMCHILATTMSKHSNSIQYDKVVLAGLRTKEIQEGTVTLCIINQLT
jgi:hypothetical protein